MPLYDRRNSSSGLSLLRRAGCRNEEKAAAAKAQLEVETGKKKFDFLKLDVMSHESVCSAVKCLDGSVDCLILNAGGPGGSDFVAQTSDGIANIMALNVVGNAKLVDELIKAKKLAPGSTIVYSSSEAARGVKSFGFPAPSIDSGSVDEFKSALDGTMYVKDKSYETTYSWAKCIGTLYFSGLARANGDYRWVSVSPGATAGTNLLNDLGLVQRLMFKMLAPIMKLFGMAHDTDAGAGRYLAVVYDTESKYDNGVFYGSKDGKLTGDLVDQTPIFEDLGMTSYQDNAVKAVENFF